MRSARPSQRPFLGENVTRRELGRTGERQIFANGVGRRRCGKPWLCKPAARVTDPGGNPTEPALFGEIFGNRSDQSIEPGITRQSRFQFDRCIAFRIGYCRIKPVNELGKHGIPHTVIADNAGGHLMQHDEVDIVIVGTDRVTRTGDVANKIGTYLKALAAHDNNVPFWVGLPSSTIDWTVSDGVREIPIEERAATEVTTITGRALDGSVATVRVVPTGSNAANPAFDVTPARLITGLITERGRCAASAEGLLGLFPERRAA